MMFIQDKSLKQIDYFMLKILVIMLIFFASVFFKVELAQAQHILSTDCGSLENHFGPFDYNDPRNQRRLKLVEDHHFTNDVFALNRSAWHKHLDSSIAYTLHVFPNHHRALDAISRLALQEGTSQLRRARYTVDCYFERGIRWQPRDATVRLLYGLHHHRFGRTEQAINELRKALDLAPENPEIHYNLGLILVRKGEYVAARRHAQRAYQLGYPLPGLRRQLERAGYWND